MKKISHFLATVLILSTLLFVYPAPVFADQIENSTLSWNYDANTATLTLEGPTQQMSYIPWKRYENSIKHIVYNNCNINDTSPLQQWYENIVNQVETVSLKEKSGFYLVLDYKNGNIIFGGKGQFPNCDMWLRLFNRNSRWSRLTISDGLTGIDEFKSTLSIDQLIIGKDVKSVNIIPFKSFQVDQNNPYFSSYNDCLYSKDFSKLVRCPYMMSIIKFHPNLSVLGKACFPGGIETSQLVIPWGVIEIEDLPRYKANTIQNFEVILPDTIKKITYDEHIVSSPMTFIYSKDNQEAHRVIKAEIDYLAKGQQPEAKELDNVSSYYGITPNSLKTFQNGKTYYFDQNCKMTKGWKQASGNWYYFNDYGAAVVKIWLKSGNKWYFMQADGTMATNKWIQWYNKWYYVGSDGAMYANRWIKSSGKWYYLGSDGAMYTNRYTPDGCWVNGSGVWVK